MRQQLLQFTLRTLILAEFPLKARQVKDPGQGGRNIVHLGLESLGLSRKT